MIQFTLNAVPKPQHKRGKKTARARGAISPSVRQKLRERSKGYCERGCGREAVHAAHITRRWKLGRTTVDDLLHLCLSCHVWADTTAGGRTWLKSKEGSPENDENSSKTLF